MTAEAKGHARGFVAAHDLAVNILGRYFLTSSLSTSVDSELQPKILCRKGVYLLQLLSQDMSIPPSGQIQLQRRAGGCIFHPQVLWLFSFLRVFIIILHTLQVAILCVYSYLKSSLCSWKREEKKRRGYEDSQMVLFQYL